MSESANSGIPSGKTKIEVAIRETEAVKRYLAGDDLVVIGRALNYSGTDDAVRATAYTTVMRALKKNAAKDAGEIRDLELSRLDAMTASLWPIAMGDLDLVRQFIDAKKTMPLRDDSAREIVYIIPSLAKLEAIEKCLKLMKRRADYLGLDFQHGLDARRQALEEEKVTLFADAIMGVLTQLNIKLDQPEVKEAIGRQFELIRGEKSA